jgi:ATP-dependent exoDNAse (exonuclease V) beta subunit
MNKIEIQSNKLYNVLSIINKHERDLLIKFQERGHKYTILSDPYSKYTSVTTWNHSHFPKFDADAIIKSMMASKSWKEGHKYWGMSADQIKKQWSNNSSEVAGAGTNMHFNIECFMNNPNLPKGYNQKDIMIYWKNKYNPLHDNSSKEWEYFSKFVNDFEMLKPYRTEWMIFHEELKLAGSIDMVYENEDGTLSIFDWKRSKEITKVNGFNKYALTQCISHLPDSNFWHYALQLNTYKAMIEEKYGKKVSQLFLVRLHPDTVENTYELLPVPIMDNEIKELFELRKREIKK